MAIGKISKGRSFSGLLTYLFKEKEREDPERERESTHERQKERAQELDEALNSHENHEKDHAWPERGERSANAEARESERAPPADEPKRESRGKIIAGNMAGRNAQELGREFDTLASLNPELQRNVFHCAIGIPAEDNVIPETKIQIAEKFAIGMGLEETMWVAVEHVEHDHHEIHTVAALVDFDGKTISDSKDFERAEDLIRSLEKEFGLREVESSREAMRRSPTQKEYKYFERTGVLSTRMRLQEHVDSAIGRGATATELIERLEARKIEVIPYVTEAGEVRGISYRLDGKVMKGGDLGRGYTWQGLQKDWPKHSELRQGRITYDDAREYAAISQARGREDERQRELRSREQGNENNERTIRADFGRTEKIQPAAGSRREEPDPAATEHRRGDEATVPTRGGGRQQVPGDGGAAERSGGADADVRGVSGRESDRDANTPGNTDHEVREINESPTRNDGQRVSGILSDPGRQRERRAPGRGVVSGSSPGMPDSGAAVQSGVRDDEHDDQRTGGNLHGAPDEGQGRLGSDDRAIAGAVRSDVPQTGHGGRRVSDSRGNDSLNRGSVHQRGSHSDNELEADQSNDRDIGRSVGANNTGDAQTRFGDDREADAGVGDTLPAERGVRLLSDHPAGQSAQQETLGADRGHATTEVETSREYAQRIELAPDTDKRTTEAMLPGRVAEPTTFEHLRQLTGVEQPAQQNLLEQLAQLTGAQSPDLATSQNLLQQLNQSRLPDEHVGREPGLSREYPETEQTPGSNREHEGGIRGHSETSPLFERTQDTEQTREPEMVHDISHDSFSR